MTAFSAIDRIYQAILASNRYFPDWMRDIFHQEMNRLTGPRTLYYLKDGQVIEEMQVPYYQATEEELRHWADYRQTHVKRKRVVSLEEIINKLNEN